jgi:hypothetical protein
MIRTGVITNPEGKRRRRRAKKTTGAAAPRRKRRVSQKRIRRAAVGTATHASLTVVSGQKRRSMRRRVRKNPEMMIGGMSVGQLAVQVLGAGAGAFAGTMGVLQINSIRQPSTRAIVKAGSAFGAMALGAMASESMDGAGKGLVQGAAIGASAVLLASALGDVFGFANRGGTNAIPTGKSTAGGVDADVDVDDDLDDEVDAMNGLVPASQQMNGPYGYDDDDIDAAVMSTLPDMGEQFGALRHEMQGSSMAGNLASAMYGHGMGFPRVPSNFPPLGPVNALQ